MAATNGKDAPYKILAKRRQKLTEEEKRRRRCCFCGIGPERIRRPVDDVKVDLENEILAAIKEGYTTFITGLEEGPDLWAGTIVARLRDDRFPELKLIAALPFQGICEEWEWQKKTPGLLAKADYVKAVFPADMPQVIRKRNEWMIDHSAKMIAVYDGKLWNTQAAISYARKSRIPVKVLEG